MGENTRNSIPEGNVMNEFLLSDHKTQNYKLHCQFINSYYEILLLALLPYSINYVKSQNEKITW